MSTYTAGDGVSAVLTDAVRDQIRILVDAIIPAGDGFPSAAEAGVHERYLDRALQVRPDIAAPMVSLARQCSEDDPGATVAQLAAAADARLEAVVEVVVACYFMSPKVGRRISYPGQVPAPILEGEDEYYLRENILAPVASRAPTWRHTGTDPGEAP
jgi:hypothetical protein